MDEIFKLLGELGGPDTQVIDYFAKVANICAENKEEFQEKMKKFQDNFNKSNKLLLKVKELQLDKFKTQFSEMGIDTRNAKTFSESVREMENLGTLPEEYHQLNKIGYVEDKFAILN